MPTNDEVARTIRMRATLALEELFEGDDDDFTYEDAALACLREAVQAAKQSPDAEPPFRSPGRSVAMVRLEMAIDPEEN